MNALKNLSPQMKLGLIGGLIASIFLVMKSRQGKGVGLVERQVPMTVVSDDSIYSERGGPLPIFVTNAGDFNQGGGSGGGGGGSGGVLKAAKIRAGKYVPVDGEAIRSRRSSRGDDFIVLPDGTVSYRRDLGNTGFRDLWQSVRGTDATNPGSGLAPGGTPTQNSLG